MLASKPHCVKQQFTHFTLNSADLGTQNDNLKAKHKPFPHMNPENQTLSGVHTAHNRRLSVLDTVQKILRWARVGTWGERAGRGGGLTRNHDCLNVSAMSMKECKEI